MDFHKLQSLVDEHGTSWKTLGAMTGEHPDKLRSMWRRYQGTHGSGIIIGGEEAEGGGEENREELWTRAIQLSKRRQQEAMKKQQRRVVFARGPVVLVAMADLHLGGSGVDYEAVDSDIRIISDLANRGVNVAVVLCGDMLDNYIIGRLKDLRMTSSPFLAVEEWGLVDYALERLAPYLVGSVAGNHDNWSFALTGIDQLRELHRRRNPGILYDPLELSFTLQVGDYECQVMARHNWRGNSMYNPSHPFDNHHLTRGRNFDIGIGAHRHIGALAREFDNNGQVGHALICGSYKMEDDYALRLGFPPPLRGSAVVSVIDEDGLMFPTSNLWSLARFLT